MDTHIFTDKTSGYRKFRTNPVGPTHTPAVDKQLPVIRRDAQDSGIEDPTMSSPMTSPTTTSGGLAEMVSGNVTTLTQKEFMVYKRAILCAQFPVLSNNPRPTHPQMESPLYRPPRSTSPGTPGTPGTPISAGSYFSYPSLQRVHNAQALADGEGGRSDAESEEEEVLIQNEMLAGVVRRAFNLSEERHRYYEEVILEGFSHKAPARILIEELVCRMSVVENNRHPFYHPQAFESRAYDNWQQGERRLISHLIESFWKFTLPTPVSSMVKPSYWQGVHLEYCDLMVRFIRLDRQQQTNNMSTCLLTSASRRLLKEFGLRYGVGELYRKLVYLDYLTNNDHFQYEVWYMNMILKELGRLSHHLSSASYQARFTMVRQEFEMLQDVLSKLHEHCKCGLQGLLQDPENLSHKTVSLVNLLAAVLDHKTQLTGRKGATLEAYLDGYIRESAKQTYQRHKLRVGVELNLNTSAEPVTAELITKLVACIQEDVRRCRDHYQSVLASFQQDVVRQAATTWYSNLMADTNLLCDISDKDPLRIDQDLLTLAQKISILDRTWRDYIPYSAQLWREPMIIQAKIWLQVMTRQLTYLVVNVVDNDTFEANFDESSAGLVEATAAHLRPRPSPINNLNPSPTSAFTSVGDSRMKGHKTVEPISRQEDESLSSCPSTKGMSSQHTDYLNVPRQPVDDTRQQADGTRQQADGTRQQADGTRLQADGTRLQADGTRLQADGTRLQAGSADVKRIRSMPEIGTPTSISLRRNLSGELLRDGELAPSPEDFRNSSVVVPTPWSSPVDGETIFKLTEGTAILSGQTVPNVSPDTVRTYDSDGSFQTAVGSLSSIDVVTPPDSLNNNVRGIINKELPSAITVIDCDLKETTGTTAPPRGFEITIASGCTTPIPQTTNSDASCSSRSLLLSSGSPPLFSTPSPPSAPSPVVRSHRDAAPSTDHKPERFSASLVDVMFMAHRLVGFMQKLIGILCPVDVDGSPGPGGDLMASVGTRTFWESMKLMKLELKEMTEDAIIKIFCLFVNNLVAMDLCATHKEKVDSLVEEQVLVGVLVNRQNGMLGRCRHEKESKVPCHYYINHDAALLCDKHEPITRQMCVRINNTWSILCLLPTLASLLQSRVRGHPPTPSVSEDDQAGSDDVHDETIKPYGGLDEPGIAGGDHVVYLNGVLQAQLQLLAYKLHLVLQQALHVLLSKDVDGLSVSDRLQPLTTCLFDHWTAMGQWLARPCLAQFMEKLWLFLVCDFEAEVQGLRLLGEGADSQALLLSQSIAHLIEFLYAQGEGLSIDQLVKPAEVVLNILQMHSLSTKNLIQLYQKALLRDAEPSPGPLPRNVLQAMYQALHKQRKCFTGHHMVLWLLVHHYRAQDKQASKRNKYRKKAQQTGQKLLDMGFILRVSSGNHMTQDMLSDDLAGFSSDVSLTDSTPYPPVTIHSIPRVSVRHFSHNTTDSSEDDEYNGRRSPVQSRQKRRRTKRRISDFYSEEGEEGEAGTSGSADNKEGSTSPSDEVGGRRVTLRADVHVSAPNGDAPMKSGAGNSSGEDSEGKKSSNSVSSNSGENGQAESRPESRPKFFSDKHHFYYFTDVDEQLFCSLSSGRFTDGSALERVWSPRGYDDRRLDDHQHRKITGAEFILGILLCRRKWDQAAREFTHSVPSDFWKEERRSLCGCCYCFS